ncbi:VWA domain-containing protein [Candidatus Omnitrophota bacterium]
MEKNKGKTAILAVVISLTAHSVFLASSPHIHMSGMYKVLDETRRIFQLGEVDERVADVSFFEDHEAAVPSLKMTKQISPAEGIIYNKMALEKMEEDLSNKKKQMFEENLNDITPEEFEKFEAEDKLRSEAEKAREEAAPEQKSLAEKLASESLVSYPVALGETEEGAVISKWEGLIPVAGKRSWRPGKEGVFQPGKKELAAIGGKAQVGEYQDIGRYLDVVVKVYEDPANGVKYFKVMVNAKAGNRLEVIPKEIIFLVDSSKSITEEKLTYIKEGLFDTLQNLNPKDRFNLVAFRGDLVKYERNSVPVGKRTVERAKAFIKKLKAVGQTDVENALLKIIEDPVSFYPSYIVFITDGRPTTGVTDSRRIIQQITRRNNMERPIFCFGGGRRVNKYLLDFISYQNRAWSRFAMTTHDMRRDFDEFYSQIKDPVLLNVRYRLIGLSAEEVFPKYLSDFYKRRSFTLYGRFDDEDVFTLQLLGQINGMTKEFIFKASLKDAERGDREIAREWAFRKIYYLISENTMGVGDPGKLRLEIEKLSRKYGIITPYDIEDSD